MQLPCPSCQKTLEYSGERPRFCAFCGKSLAAAPSTAEVPAADAVTAPPSDPAQTATIIPAPPDAPAPAAAVPETIGGYRLLRRLGGGGMGAVYEAEEAVSGRRVALKLVLPQYAGSPETLARFRQEGRLASSLAHPRCVFVLAADEEAGRPYIVMELMPGQTLDDLVRQRGPLPVEEALAKILDVIDGLAEAHRRGLVHRDVKPSNCFLDAAGRVKVGDFGLSRSLVSDAKLTRTGTFVGTPPYAAPEQVKRETIDVQSDVYSVAATLYFLLTGRAPFQSAAGDAMATLARIVSDDPPPLRGVRPDLPRALDRVVRRGLERDRRRRYKDLHELRAALLPFLPARPSVSGLSLRFAASLIDLLVLSASSFAMGHAIGRLRSSVVAASLLGYGAGMVVNLAYYGLLEGLLGWSVGKYLLRLRVGTATGTKPPGIARAALRAASLYVLFNLGPFVGQLLLMNVASHAVGRRADPATALLVSSIGCGILAWHAIAAGAILSTMRARNGYRGLHEFVSGTRTYHLRWPRPQPRRAIQVREFHLDVSRPEGLPARVGPFEVRGALRWGDRERTLVAEDAQLGRAVWLWLRPASEPPLDAARRDISRSTRVRWVACGTDGPWQYDALLAPAGMPLPVLAAGTPRLSWADVRPILDDLAEEMEASCAEGTLPRQLSPHQVWVQPDGRVQLLGTPLAASADEGIGQVGVSADVPDEARALDFLRQVAVLALEGRTRPLREADRARAPVPLHATHVLARLMGGRDSYPAIAELRQDLEAIRDRPAEVSRVRRAGHLAFTTLLLHLPFGGPSLMAVFSLVAVLDAMEQVGRSPHDTGEQSTALGVIAACGAFWVVWAFLFRGGYAYWRGGIVLRRADGRKAARWQCALRAALVWAPVGGLYALAVATAMWQPALWWVHLPMWGAATLLLPLYVALALWRPRRLLHDRVAGTYPVPE